MRIHIARGQVEHIFFPYLRVKMSRRPWDLTGEVRLVVFDDH